MEASNNCCGTIFGITRKIINEITIGKGENQKRERGEGE